MSILYHSNAKRLRQKLGTTRHSSANNITNPAKLKLSGCQLLQMHNLVFSCDSSSRVVVVKLTFHDFKHSYNQRPFTLTIYCQSTCCPIQILLDYLTLRSDREGPIFITHGGLLVAHEAFALQLSEAIPLYDLDPARCKRHSFRIGTAWYAAGQGMSILKFVSSVNGNPMPFTSIFEFHPCLHDWHPAQYIQHYLCIASGQTLEGSVWPCSNLCELPARAAISYMWFCICFDLR